MKILKAVLVWTVVMILVGCTSSDEREPVDTSSFVQTETIRQGTILRLEDGWGIGLQMVYEGEYTDDAGQKQRGMIARLSVGNDNKPDQPAAQLDLPVNAEFDAGKRYRIVQMEKRQGFGGAGSGQSFVMIGELP